jgi:hypothetical protein
MYHHMEFDPYLSRECNQQVSKEVQALRLEKRLRKNHKEHTSQLIAFTSRARATCFTR